MEYDPSSQNGPQIQKLSSAKRNEKNKVRSESLRRKYKAWSVTGEVWREKWPIRVKCKEVVHEVKSYRTDIWCIGVSCARKVYSTSGKDLVRGVGSLWNRHITQTPWLVQDKAVATDWACWHLCMYICSMCGHLSSCNLDMHDLCTRQSVRGAPRL